MEFNLKKDLCCFDLEATGLSIVKDRICQIAITKIFADGRPDESKVRLVNPGIPIPEGASKVNGITDDMVKDAPPFEKIAKALLEFIGDSDLLSFNGNRFDIPLLMEECARVGHPLDMTGRRTIDAQRIFHQMERRDLTAAYKFFTGKKLEGAHRADTDVMATIEVTKAMLDRYKGVDCEKGDTIITEPVRNDMQALHDFTNDPNEIDFAGKIKRDEKGRAVFTFGKYQLLPVGESLANDSKYHSWIKSGDFTTQTKLLCDILVNEYIAQRGI